MKICPWLLLWIFAQCCDAQGLRTHLKYCGRQIVEGDDSISVAVTEAENTDQQRLEVGMDSGHIPAIKYSDVKVRVYDQFGEEIAVSPAVPLPDVYNLVGDAEQSGSYNLELKKGQSARIAHLTWRHAELTFSVPQAWAFILDEKSGPTLEVWIVTDTDLPVSCTEVNTRAFGKRGPQIDLAPAQRQAEADATSRDAEKSLGRYRVLLRPGQKVGYVYLSWKDREIGFYVPDGVPGHR